MSRLPILLLLLILPLGQSALATTITLLNGDTLSGEIIEQTDQQLVFQHATLGLLHLDTTQLSGVEPIIAAAPEPKLATTSASRETHIEAGLNGVQGNSRHSKYRLGLNQRAENELNRHHLQLAYHGASSDGETDENEFFTELTRDWLLPNSPWFRFARGRYDWDEFEDWDHRLSGSGGLGYQFYNRETFSLAGRFGLGANRTFGGTEDELDPEGLLGLDSRWQISKTQHLTFDSTLYPELDEVGEYRNISTLNWLIDIDQHNGLRLKLGIANEYESTPEPGSSSSDLKYDLSLQWQL